MRPRAILTAVLKRGVDFKKLKLKERPQTIGVILSKRPDLFRHHGTGKDGAWSRK
jgi:hypothetical protein